MTDVTLSIPALTLIATNVIMLISIYVRVSNQLTKNETRLDGHEKRLDILEGNE